MLRKSQYIELIEHGWMVSVIRYFGGSGGKVRRKQYDDLLTLAERGGRIQAEGWSLGQTAEQLGTCASRLQWAFDLYNLSCELGIDPRTWHRLDPLVTGARDGRKAGKGDAKRLRVARLRAKGLKVSDIALITGWSRASIYRMSRPVGLSRLEQANDPLLA